jgi:hypothetical protein
MQYENINAVKEINGVIKQDREMEKEARCRINTNRLKKVVSYGKRVNNSRHESKYYCSTKKKHSINR